MSLNRPGLSLILMMMMAFVSQASASTYEHLTSERLEAILQTGQDPLRCIRKSGPIEKQLWHFTGEKILSLVEESGFRKVGPLNIAQLKRQISKIEVLINACDRTLIGSSTRRGSIYLAEQKTIIVNIANFESGTKGGEPVMFTHEFLGALGYPDENYELSTLLVLAGYSKALKLSESSRLLIGKAVSAHLDKNPIRGQNIEFMVAGGVSSVGGGGEPASAELKLHLLFAALDSKLPEENVLRLLNTVVQQRIETEAPAKAVVGDFGLKGMTGALLAGRWILLIDEKVWRQAKANKKEAKTFLTNLYLITMSVNKLSLRGEPQ